jgi:hypothetical protein
LAAGDGNARDVRDARQVWEAFEKGASQLLSGDVEQYGTATTRGRLDDLYDLLLFYDQALSLLPPHAGVDDELPGAYALVTVPPMPVVARAPASVLANADGFATESPTSGRAPDQAVSVHSVWSSTLPGIESVGSQWSTDVDGTARLDGRSPAGRDGSG